MPEFGIITLFSKNGIFLEILQMKRSVDRVEKNPGFMSIAQPRVFPGNTGQYRVILGNTRLNGFIIWGGVLFPKCKGYLHVLMIGHYDAII